MLSRERTEHSLIGARQGIPAEQIASPVRSLAMELPPSSGVHGQGPLSIDFVADDESTGAALSCRSPSKTPTRLMCCRCRLKANPSCDGMAARSVQKTGV